MTSLNGTRSAQVVPLGKGSSMAEEVSLCVKTIAQSSLKYAVTAMGTDVEGDVDEVRGNRRGLIGGIEPH